MVWCKHRRSTDGDGGKFGLVRPILFYRDEQIVFKEFKYGKCDIIAADYCEPHDDRHPESFEEESFH